MKKTQKTLNKNKQAEVVLAQDKARARGRAKAGLDAASGLRAFATTKYPTFGRGVYSEQNPPATVTSSPFYWWYRFLLLNEDYKKALTSKKTTGIDRQVVKDFGNVHSVDFKTWWNAHVHLFAEPLCMTRADLIARLAARFEQLQLKDAELSVRAILDGLSATLAKGGRAEIRGFGSFALNYKPPRTGRNPKTGASVQVPAKYVPHFKAGKELRERVDR